MSYVKHEVTYPSSDGKHTIVGVIYTPSDMAPRGIVQLSHGMIDYVERYEFLAAALTDAGYIFAGNHHLGHGRSVLSPEDYGFFTEEGDGILCLLRDLHQMNRLLREKFPSLPVIMMGHSMGSFLSRLYVERYPHTVTGHIIHGTGGPHKLILPIGRALIAIIALFRGKRYRSKLISAMAFSGYNSKFPKSEGKYAWLTRDLDTVAERDEDKYTQFIFTLEGYRELFRMISKSNSGKWYSNYPKTMRTLIISGDMDPVGQNGRGVKYVYKHLLVNGVGDLKIKMYPGARHELFNETCREEVFSDILEWINQCIK